MNQTFIPEGKFCQTYSVQPNYPSRLKPPIMSELADKAHAIALGQNIQPRPGYNPIRPNPGGKAFSFYFYPYQTQNHRPLYGAGLGWDTYAKTGRLPQ